MKTLFKACLALFLFNYSLQIQAQDPSPFTVPYELAIVGFDTEISTSGDDQFILLNTIEISSGYQFNITNLNYDNTNGINEWKNSFNQVITNYNLEYTGSQPIPMGSYIYLTTGIGTQSPIRIEIDRNDYTPYFNITDLSNGIPNGGFITAQGGFFNLYTGYMVFDSSHYKLLGTVIDGIATGKTNTEMIDKTPSDISNKEYLITSLTNNMSAMSYFELRDKLD